VKIIKVSQTENLGDKAVGYKDGQGFSLYGGGGLPVDITIGSVMENLSPSFHGFFLGSSKKYVLDYYSGLTEEDELLLTYSYSSEDVIGNQVESDRMCDGEVRVKRATLINIESIPKD
jgi:hypothetical protein